MKIAYMKLWKSLVLPLATSHSLSLHRSSKNHEHQSIVSVTTSTKAKHIKTNVTMSVYIHSTFRDENGRQVLPSGLEWDMDGDSHVRFMIGKGTTPESIMEAYNRWCCAKDLPYKTKDDILSITPDGPDHVNVHWKQGNHDVEQVIRGDSIEALLRADEACQGDESAEVRINGAFQGVLTQGTLQSILEKVPKTANKLCYKRSKNRIYIDRYYTSFLRYNQAWDHVWDCVLALEDPKILDSKTIIGTATLSDWIMGGELTSRLWIQDKGASIVFKRPLYDDDLSTADRKYEIKDEQRMAMVRAEMDRFRFLAKLRHPYVAKLLADRETKKRAKEEKKEEIGALSEPIRTLGTLCKKAQHFGF